MNAFDPVLRPNAIGSQITRPKANPMRNTMRKRGDRARNRTSFSTRAPSGSGSHTDGNLYSPSSNPRRPPARAGLAAAAWASNESVRENCHKPNASATAHHNTSQPMAEATSAPRIRLEAAVQGDAFQE